MNASDCHLDMVLFYFFSLASGEDKLEESELGSLEQLRGERQVPADQDEAVDL